MCLPCRPGAFDMGRHSSSGVTAAPGKADLRGASGAVALLVLLAAAARTGVVAPGRGLDAPRGGLRREVDPEEPDVLHRHAGLVDQVVARRLTVRPVGGQVLLPTLLARRGAQSFDLLESDAERGLGLV